jgi:hypothetical protein
MSQDRSKNLGIHAENSAIRIENLILESEAQRKEKKSLPAKIERSDKEKTDLINLVQELKIAKNKIILVQRSLNEVPIIANLIYQRKKSIEEFIRSQAKKAEENLRSEFGHGYNDTIWHRLILEEILVSFSEELNVSSTLIDQIKNTDDIQNIFKKTKASTLTREEIKRGKRVKIKVAGNLFDEKIGLLCKTLSRLEEIERLFERPPTLDEKAYLLARENEIYLPTLKSFLDAEEVRKADFRKIADLLNLDPFDVIDFDLIETIHYSLPSVKSIHYGRVKQQCGVLRILDLPSPVELNDFFVDVKILSEPMRYRRLTVSELPKIYDPEKNEFDRWRLGDSTSERVSGLKVLENNTRLMILGKPGSGKTSFLKHIAIQCVKENFMQDYVPLFIELKSFSEEFESSSEINLFDYLEKQFSLSGDLHPDDFVRLFEHGRVLILLDGLDEVSENDSPRVESAIIKFCKEYYKNRIVITCRTAAVGDEFVDFTYVEIADFDDRQIQKFAANWFITVEKATFEAANQKAMEFLTLLNNEKNQQIKEIAVTPILLSLTCLVFQSQFKLPSKRAKLYEEALDILLEKWDDTKRVKRDNFYYRLSAKQKIDLLSYIAALTFESERFFFEKKEVLKYIEEYYSSLNQENVPSNLSQDKFDNSEAILKSIEVQHGLLIERARNIYSFCQLTFHEYFTAQSVIKGISSSGSEGIFGRVPNKSWREIFLLATELVGEPVDMIFEIKKKVDEIAFQSERIQELILWAQKKALNFGGDYSKESLRAFYFMVGSEELMGKTSFEAFSTSSLAVSMDENFRRIFQICLRKGHVIDRAVIAEHECILAIELTLSRILFFLAKHDMRLLGEVDKFLGLCNGTGDAELLAALSQELKITLRDKGNINRKKWRDFSKFIPEIRGFMLNSYGIGHDWKFGVREKRLLRNYYSSSALLFDCLNLETEVDRSFREGIIQSMFAL